MEDSILYLRQSVSKFKFRINVTKRDDTFYQIICKIQEKIGLKTHVNLYPKQKRNKHFEDTFVTFIFVQ